ncbi:hypothetical protein GCM10007897_07410 [Sphingobium jiangsuense]|nr:hypothetical protein GCM10007897_07410 [Sphingobium jiangsuense]
MENPGLTLYHFPGACSGVAVCALEAAGLDYELKLIDITAGQQSEPSYLALSALGKVPLLLIDGVPLSENAAILTYIAALRPEAGLFPADSAPRARAEAVGGLSFCGGTLHPIIRGIANPQRLTDGDIEGVRSRSKELAKKSFGYADRRLAERGWWLGERSIVDVYLYWAFGVARNAGFDASPFAALVALEDRLKAEMPGFAAMLDINARARAELGH